MSSESARWVRIVVDYAAPIAFVATLLITHDFQRATWVLVGGCAVALAVGWLAERRLAILPLFAGLMALVFGTLTLIFHDPSFVKMKLTFVDTALAAGLIGGMALGKNPLKALLGEAFTLPDAAWRVLTIRYAVFFIACAGANEAVWRTQSNETWGIFRLILLGAAVGFSAIQAPFLLKHSAKPADAEPPDPPDPGF
ncbi:MAG TPA: septation protein IspZ [Caulobacteraceae bacterium]|jgi:intracellular septation protein|nr:septation protein IspZ [Caulobacteraceae bacterium]